MTFNTSSFARRALCGVAASVVGLGLSVLPAHAQDPYYHDSSYDQDTDYTTLEGVTVSPPRVIGRSAIGAPIELVQAHRVVTYRDLDLTSGYDAHILKVRIERAARSACDELSNRYDAYDGDGRDCYRDAVRDGMEQVAYNVGYEPEGWWAG